MRWTACALLVVASTLVPSAFGALASAAGPRGAFLIGTVLMVALAALLTALWPRETTPAANGQTRYWPAAVAGVAGLIILSRVAWQLLPVAFAGPLDPNRADMLVIIEHAITQLLAGGNPYAIHQVPWDAPLSYGPVLWLPFVVPHVLRVDLRILTLAAQLTVPALVLFQASWRAGRGDAGRAIVLGALGVALAFNPDIMRFHAIGQTQVYWPLLLVFCGLLAGERWTAAAVCLGLLVAARTTMVAIVPVFLIHLAVIRQLSRRRIVVLALACALPFLPFVLVDPRTVWYAMVGVYTKVMKGYVWQSTTWAIDTYGITGRLLEHGLERYVELVQGALLIATYALAWRALRRGGRPEPWMALALLIFSMTTLWPVIYLYFDVWILLAGRWSRTMALAGCRRGVPDAPCPPQRWSRSSSCSSRPRSGLDRPTRSISVIPRRPGTRAAASDVTSP